MSISIQASTAAHLASLESLTSQSSNSAGGATGAGATSLLDALTPKQSQSASSIIDVSGGLPSLAGLSSGLAVSASIADAAVAAGSTVEGLLAQMRQDAVSASNPDLDADSRAALNSGFRAGLGQIQKAIAAAGVEGTNLLDGSADGAAAASAATLTGIDLSLGGALIGVGADASLSDSSTAASIAAQLGDAIDKVGQALDGITSQAQAIDTHLALVAQAGLALSPGVAAGVNTGLDSDGARLAALQVQQQLSASQGGVANQSPNAMLALFRAS
ncbi:MAG TPA: flagellin [Caulobacteraceae bacterium]|nr:flagellin [Caulobacteraceae bacterium]